MPSSARMIRKDSHPALIAWHESNNKNEKITGREYNVEIAQAQPATAVQIKDVLYGIKMACLSITDDEPDTLQKVGAMNPWQIQSMKIITGSTEKAHAPLTQLLQEDFDLTLDHHISVSGVSKAGHALDTQGFIAHNDSTIVLSYRCTTSAADWLTNLTTTTSAWEIEEDVAQGHSGWFSCMAGFCGSGGDTAAPRVHTGFYNNFLVTVPKLREYIDPLLAADQPKRTLYVVGHSLGAGIATLAGCYFLLESPYDWSHHQLRIVTAGGPRACGTSMVKAADAALTESRGGAQFLRCVRDKDGVANVPPAVLGFGHVTHSLVFITKEDAATGQAHILIDVNRNSVAPKKVLTQLAEEHEDLEDVVDDDEDDSNDDEDTPRNANATVIPKALDHEELEQDYEKKINMIPRSLRDHMPEFYLRPLYRCAEQEEKELSEK